MRELELGPGSTRGGFVALLDMAARGAQESLLSMHESVLCIVHTRPSRGPDRLNSQQQDLPTEY